MVYHREQRVGVYPTQGEALRMCRDRRIPREEMYIEFIDEPHDVQLGPSLQVEA